MKGVNDGVYFLNRQHYDNYMEKVIFELDKAKKVDSMSNSPKSDQYYDGLLDNKSNQYINESHLLYLTFDEFIKEVSPPQYYEKNMIWSTYLKLSNDAPIKTSDNENKNLHSNSLHTVNGFWRNQPYGSRSNPEYRPKWIDSFERGGKKVKETA